MAVKFTPYNSCLLQLFCVQSKHTHLHIHIILITIIVAKSTQNDVSQTQKYCKNCDIFYNTPIGYTLSVWNTLSSTPPKQLEGFLLNLMELFD